MKRACFNLCWMFLLSFVLILSACKPESIPHAAAPQTPDPEASPVIQTAPSVTHTWQASPMLAMLFTSAGYTLPDYAWSMIPSFILYADGRVIVTEERYQAGDSSRAISEGRLNSAEICSLLNQIAADGFLTLKQSDYSKPHVTDQGTTQIAINAWQPNAISAYGLGFALYQKDSGVQIPPALKATAERLLSYLPPNAQPYQPDRLAIRLDKTEAQIAAPLWPLSQPTLTELMTTASSQSNVLLVEGQAARDIYHQFAGSFSKIYAENGQTYGVTIRPVFPYEEWLPDQQGWSPVPVFATEPQTALTCSPNMAAVETPLTATAAPTVNPTASGDLPEAPLKRVTEFGRRDSPGQLNYPAGLAILSENELLVGDAGNERFQVFSLDGKFLREIPLPEPTSLFWDFQRMADGSLYILDFGNAVRVMSSDGQITATFSGWPQDEKDFSTHLAVSPDRTIYLAETRGKRVVILNADGTLREIWQGPADMPFDNIMSLAADTQGNLYVASDDQNRVVKRDLHGDVQEFKIKSPRTVLPLPDGSFFTLGAGGVTHYDVNGQAIQRWAIEGMMFPHYLAQALDGSIFVMDDDSLNKGLVIQHYSQDGKLLNQFGSTADEPGQFGSHLDYAPSDQGDIWVMEMKSEHDEPKTSTRLVHVSASDDHLNTFEALNNVPFTCDRYALATGPDQAVFVADPCASIIAQVNSAGKILQRWGEKGTGPGQFNLIRSLHLTSDGQSLLIVDEGNHRILQFGFDGTLQREWPAKELGVQQPDDVVRDPAGIFYLLDGATQEVVIHTGISEVRRWRVPVQPDQYEEVNTIAVDPVHGRIYVGDTRDNLYVYDRAGNLLGREGIYGGSGVIVKLDHTGRVYASSGYARISRFEPLP